MSQLHHFVLATAHFYLQHIVTGIPPKTRIFYDVRIRPLIHLFGKDKLNLELYKKRNYDALENRQNPSYQKRKIIGSSIDCNAKIKNTAKF